MPSATDRIEFLPPAPPGMLRAFGLAILAHLFLLGALTWGVNWKRQQSDTITAEAELWSSLPQQAAPKAQEPAPPPSPQPVPEPVVPKVIAPPPPAPVPAPEVKPEPQPAKVDIALEKEKEKKKLLALEEEQDRQQKKEAKLKEDKAKQIADKKAQELAAQKKAAEDAKKAAQKKAEEDAQRAATAAAQAGKDAKDSAEQREANLRRMAGLAGASGGPSATGTAPQSTGWSSSYGGKVKARVKPNVVFSGSTSGNPSVTLRIKLAPDGTILGRPQVLKSSGNSEWDEAVVRAFEKTEVLPKDVDGQVRSELEVVWRPND
jgi:colicin import membrane protein